MTKKLKVLCLIKPQEKTLFAKLIKDWEKYFRIQVTIDAPHNLDQYLTHAFDLIFASQDQPMSNEKYAKYKKAHHNFAYILMAPKPSEDDVFRFKHLVDRIIYTGISYRYTKWSTIASLRRFWDQYAKPSTIIYRNIIADFVEQKFMINQKEQFLTLKESRLLRYFLENRGKIMTKEEIFQKVWEYNTPDSTRVFDQMFFKLKAKVGKDYFKVKRNQGIIFE